MKKNGFVRFTFDLTIPKNLEPEQLLQQSPPVDFQGVTPDGIALICNAIVDVLMKYDEDKIKDGFAPLHSQILHRHNPDYYPCVQYLLQAGVIECDNYFVRSEKSKGYRFTEKYRSGGFAAYTIKSHARRRSYQRIRRETVKTNIERCKDVKHLTQFFDPAKLKIGHQEAMFWINTKREREISPVYRLRISKRERQQRETEIISRFDLYRLMVQNFTSGEFHCSVDDTGYRFHSALTNIKKELRPFITYDGQPLIAIDMKNSQPFLALLLFKESFYKKSRLKKEISLYNLFPDLYLHLRSNGKINKLREICRRCNSLRKTLLDVEHYRESVINGTFYDDFFALVNSGVKKKQSISRDSLKRQVLTIFYGDLQNDQLQGIPAVQSFRHLYPNVSAVFKLMMDRRYEDFAWLMQRIESRLVLNVISKRFVKENPGCPIFTIHDSLHVTEDKTPELTSILEDEMYKFIGAAPAINVDGELVHADINREAQITETINEIMENDTLESNNSPIKDISPWASNREWGNKYYGWIDGG